MAMLPRRRECVNMGVVVARQIWHAQYQYRLRVIYTVTWASLGSTRLALSELLTITTIIR